MHDTAVKITITYVFLRTDASEEGDYSLKRVGELKFMYNIYCIQTLVYIYIYIYMNIQGVPGRMDKTSGECSLC